MAEVRDQRAGPWAAGNPDAAPPRATPKSVSHSETLFHYSKLMSVTDWACQNSGRGLFRTFWNSVLAFTDQNVLEQSAQTTAAQSTHRWSLVRRRGAQPGIYTHTYIYVYRGGRRSRAQRSAQRSARYYAFTGLTPLRPLSPTLRKMPNGVSCVMMKIVSSWQSLRCDLNGLAQSSMRRSAPWPLHVSASKRHLSSRMLRQR